MDRRFEERKRELLEDCQVVPEVFQGMMQRLDDFVRPFVRLLSRSEQCEHALQYCSGLLSDLEQKNCEAIAYRHDEDRQGLQLFIGSSPWDHRPWITELGRQVGEEIGEADGVIALDPSAFPKSGEHSVGTQRQWCGRLGKLENCQVGVFMGYVSREEHALVNMRPYLPKEGVMSVEDYRAFFAERVADAVAEAWNGRVPGSVTWGLGHAVVAYNRRAVYANGSARMYGATNVPEFRGLEGYEDHDVPVSFAWNAEGELIGMAVNVACPSQEVESGSTIHADFWHSVRAALRQQYGEQLCVLGWTGAAGDQSPHLMYRKAADERMRQLRGLSRLDEIARRIVRAVDDVYQAVQADRHTDVKLVHRVKTVALPMRLVTEAEYAEAQAAVEQAKAQIARDPKATDRVFRRMKWYETTVERFDRQQTEPQPKLDMELHVVRIGDAVICTNQFELFTDYGIRIKARSRAVQTFLIQLAGPGTYLPTEKAVRGGHYSAIVHSSLVGPAGGQELVDRTVELIDSAWED